MWDFVYKILGTVGGIGVLSFGLWKLLGGMLRDSVGEMVRGQVEMKLEDYRQRLENNRVSADRYADSQFDVYRRVWKELKALDRVGDDLWENASEQNVERFAERLRQTSQLIEEEAILFEEEEFNELTRLLDAFSNYRVGKKRLVEVRREDRDGGIGEIQAQIQNNREHKERYEDLLDEIRQSFKERLSRVVLDNAV